MSVEYLPLKPPRECKYHICYSTSQVEGNCNTFVVKPEEWHGQWIALRGQSLVLGEHEDDIVFAGRTLASVLDAIWKAHPPITPLPP